MFIDLNWILRWAMWPMDLLSTAPLKLLNRNTLLAELSSNVGAWGMWACSLSLFHYSIRFFGIIIVHWGSMFLDFVVTLTHKFMSPRIFNKVWIVLHCNATNKSSQNYVPTNQHNFDNPQTCRPQTNSNVSTIIVPLCKCEFWMELWLIKMWPMGFF